MVDTLNNWEHNRTAEETFVHRTTSTNNMHINSCYVAALHRAKKLLSVFGSYAVYVQSVSVSSIQYSLQQL
ncbi:hypothetical protein KIN20_001724 [Parelaphostrongylus tenuis]|uniref:Uncharacterized protein n=1 Tax=Parelaphostrongylus tenuis TaxID=148309 RepID=A0AAD5MD81_PARTN|nr:hypothetical protein KIN20_001724 [Parelaphostrongylus tenuis]